MEDGGAEKVRFGRTQKFRLTDKGSQAVASYTLMIEAAKQGTGRGEFDAARKAWCAPLGLVPEDGMFLLEFGAGGRSLKEASASLDACGTTPKEVKTALERLMKLGLLDAVPEPPPPAAAPYRRPW